MADDAMRSVVAQIVAAITPWDDLERQHVDAVGRWLAAGEPFIRTTPPDVPPQHFVSYFVLVDCRANRLLLVDHRKALLWLPAGGHVEPNEHPRTTVERELAEELGLPAVFLDDVPLFVTVTRTAGTTAVHTDVSLWYVIEAACDEPVAYDRREVAGIQWFDFDAVPWERSDPHMRRFVAKLQARLAAGG